MRFTLQRRPGVSVLRACGLPINPTRHRRPLAPRAAFTRHLWLAAEERREHTRLSVWGVRASASPAYPEVTMRGTYRWFRDTQDEDLP